MIGTALLPLDIDWARATYLSILLIIVAGSYIVSSSNRFRDLRAIAMWTGIVAILVLVYAFREEGKIAWQRVAASVVPGYVISENGELVVVRRKMACLKLAAR